METNPQLGGVCGEIAARNPKLLNPVEAAQNFEYKMSHMLDKGVHGAVSLAHPVVTACSVLCAAALESVFGFISVLPGAFCAYRWSAIQGEPLEAYFYTEKSELSSIGPFVANMYLAEDRVRDSPTMAVVALLCSCDCRGSGCGSSSWSSLPLCVCVCGVWHWQAMCVELLCKPGEAWTLRYIADSVAITDVPSTLIDLLKQRRRWLNGAFFSLVFYVFKFPSMLFRARHSLLRRLCLLVQFVYQTSWLALSWFAISTYFLCLFLAFGQALASQPVKILNDTLFAVTAVFGVVCLIQVRSCCCGESCSLAADLMAALTLAVKTAGAGHERETAGQRDSVQVVQCRPWSADRSWICTRHGHSGDSWVRSVLL